MKYHLTTIILLCTLSLYSQSTIDSLRYKVNYELSFQPDSTDVFSRKKETMHLYLGEQISQFNSRGRALSDSLHNSIDKGVIGSTVWKNSMAESKTDFDHKITKNRANNYFYYDLKILQDKLFYTEPLPKLKWEITSETKDISGFKVQKAFTSYSGRDYIAWFTPEIPISDGPYKFSGLPGLILEIHDTSNEYVFTFQGFEELPGKIGITLPPETYQESSKKDLLALKNRYEQDPMKYINNYVGKEGKRVTVKINGQSKNDYLRKRKAKLAKNNNPIELE